MGGLKHGDELSGSELFKGATDGAFTDAGFAHEATDGQVAAIGRIGVVRHDQEDVTNGGADAIDGECPIDRVHAHGAVFPSPLARSGTRWISANRRQRVRLRGHWRSQGTSDSVSSCWKRRISG